MSRCGHDGVFYRVFCITLLAIAFCFTVILTNVFIDIDGLLAGQEKANTDPPIHIDNVNANKQITTVENANPEENFVVDENSYKNNLDDNENSNYYRTKRSLESATSKFNMENRKIKNIISNRLASLLDELDSEEAKGATTQKVHEQTQRIDVTTQSQETKENYETTPQTQTKETPKIRRRENKEKRLKDSHDFLHKLESRRLGQPKENHKELLRLAMQNLLLGGVINHLDLNDIYNEVHSLVEDFNGLKGKPEIEDANSWEQAQPNINSEVNPNHNSNEIKEFLDELYTYVDKKKSDKRTKKHFNENKKTKKVFINATIDIITNDKENTTLQAGDVKGSIKINYNGVPVQLKKTTDIFYNEALDGDNSLGFAMEQTVANPENLTYLHQFLRQYAKMYSDNQEIKLMPTYTKTVHKYKATRMKRHIKVQLNDKKDTPLMEHVKNNIHSEISKNEDDDVSVEINTHFNNKGINVEKKKKLIGTIIEKIAQVIQHSSQDYKSEAKTKIKKTMKHWNVKRRAQNPLENESTGEYPKYFSAYPVPKSSHLKLQNFNKVLGPHKHDALKIPSRRHQNKPKIFSSSKAINSAETGKVDIFYDSVLPSNGIPQRLQKPLTSENIDSQDNLFSNTHNVKFLIKNIDGSGFSIGINQYTDLPPDAESMKIFTALESLIKAYQQKYDFTDEENDSVNHKEKFIRFEHSHSISKRDTGNINQKYTGVFKNLLRDSKFDKKNTTTQNLNVLNVFSKNDIVSNHYVLSKKNVENGLQTSEIFKSDRKSQSIFPRSIPYKFKRQKSFTNLNRKIRVNRYMTSKPVTYFKQVFFRNKRNKRQISVLDEIQNDHDDGMFVVSDEDEVADKAVTNNDPEEDIGAIVNKNDNIDNYRKFHENEDNSYNYLINRRRHNKMMSNYPHIFYENSEKFLRDDPENFPSQYLKTKITVNKLPEQPLIDDKATEFNNESGKSGDLQQLVHAISPSIAKENYKVTIKIKPFKKNVTTGDVTGFKQIHTSINKSFNRNGMNFMTSFNVSEVSKIEKVGKEGEKVTVDNNLGNIHKDNDGNVPLENLANETNSDKNDGVIQSSYQNTLAHPTLIENNNNTPYTSTFINKEQQENDNNRRQTSDTRSQNTMFVSNQNNNQRRLEINHPEQQQNDDNRRQKSDTRSQNTMFANNPNNNQQRLEINHPEQQDTDDNHRQNSDPRHQNTMFVSNKNNNQQRLESNQPYEKSEAGMADGLLDITIPSNPPKLLRLNRDEVSKIVSSTLEKLQDIPNFRDLKETLNKQQITTTDTTPATATTVVTQKTPKNELLLAKIIGYNVQLTNEILKRIDSNTDMLSTFLDKLDSTIIQPAHTANLAKHEEVKKHPDDEHLSSNKALNMKHKGNVLVYSFQHPHFVVGKKPTATTLCRRMVDKGNKPDTKSIYYKGPTHFNINQQTFINNQTNSFVNDGAESTDTDTPNGPSEMALPTNNDDHHPHINSDNGNMRDIEISAVNKK